MPDKEYIIFCDESDAKGKYYSNFYGGVLVGSSQYDRITARLNAEKHRLNLFGEVKWSKVTAKYLAKCESLIREFFKELRAKHLCARVMFRQNAHVPVGLSQDQIEGAYFRLYYQFIKHAFGLKYRPHTGQQAALIWRKLAVRAEKALKLGRLFNFSPELWMGIQSDYDLEVARDRSEADIFRRIHPLKLVAAAP